MRKNRKKPAAARTEGGDVFDRLVFYLSLALLVLVPVSFSPWVYYKYSLPKFVVLLVGSSLLVLLLTIKTTRSPLKPAARFPLVKSRLVWMTGTGGLVSAYAVAQSLGVEPFVSRSLYIRFA